MTQILDLLADVMSRYGLITAFAIVGITVWVSYQLSARLTRGKLHGSAIAIMLGLLAAYVGGVITGGSRGIADLEVLAGIGLMGGGMLRDFAIIATAFGVDTRELARAGAAGVISLFTGVFVSFAIGATVAYAFGYTDPVSMTTIGGGAATYIVGPVTGAAIGASSDVIALSIAAEILQVRRQTPKRPGTPTAGSGTELETRVALDPVCGMTVTIATASYTSDHGGQTFYFCSAQCQGSFQREPERYLIAPTP